MSFPGAWEFHFVHATLQWGCMRHAIYLVWAGGSTPVPCSSPEEIGRYPGAVQLRELSGQFLFGVQFSMMLSIV